jgi:hypothetical protein
VWWWHAIIPALGRLRKEDCEFQVFLIYIMRPGSNFKKPLKELSEKYGIFSMLRESFTWVASHSQLL